MEKLLKLQNNISYINHVLTNNYIYSIDYDIDGHTDCENHGCIDEGLCRCYTIDSVDIKSVDIPSIAISMLREIDNSSSIAQVRNSRLSSLLYGGTSEEIDIYCIDRILRINKVYNPENWDITWSHNYYGEEIDSIKIYSSIYNKVCFDIEELISLDTLDEKIELILKKEYGYISPKLTGKTYEVLNVISDDIVFGQIAYKKKLEKEKNTFEFYSDVNYRIPIRGICSYDMGKFRVIDGYHRILSTREKTIRILVANDK